jgi:hypothetical protein
MPLIETKGAASAQGFGEFLQTGPVNYIEDVFSTYLYTGNGSTQTITNGIDLSGKGGLVWAKSRSTITFHDWEDTVRGAGNAIYSNSTNASDYSANRITSFNSDGYSLGSVEPNVNNRTYASWTFRKQPKFFDVVTFTAPSVADFNYRVSHSLGSTPGCIILKSVGNAVDWQVYHRSFGRNYNLQLNLSDAATNNADYWGTSDPTSTDFGVKVSGSGARPVNVSGGTYVAYLFAHNAGGFGLSGTDNVISCGSFSGGGTTVNLGWEPQWILAKRTETTGDWYIDDNMRGWPAAGSNDNPLLANTTAAEPTGYAGFANITSTGFTNNFNGDYIYIAIRRGPMKVPTSGTSVFYPIARTGTSTATSISNIGFVPDSFISQNRNTPGDPGPATSLSIVLSRLTALQYLRTQLTNAEATSTEVTSWNQSGVSLSADIYGRVNWSSIDAINYFFGRAPSFFDVVCYTGTGSATTQTHNLGVAPELMIVKSRSSSVYDWRAYSATLGATQYLTPNTTQSGAASSTSWNDTAPTASVFTVGSSAVVNGSGGTYVAYLFATCAGVSKVGSYTGTGTTKQIDCGFTGGARFVLIKRTDSTGDWFYWDSSRGIVAGNDPYLRFNSTAAEVTSTDYVDTYSAGFEISSTAPAGINANGGTFIFLAIA